MSIAEMKLAAIDQINRLEDEKDIKEILEHLAKISGNETNTFDAGAFFQKSTEKYDDALQKLAQ